MTFLTPHVVALSLVTLFTIATLGAQGRNGPGPSDQTLADATGRPSPGPNSSHAGPLTLAHIPELAAAARTPSDHVLVAEYLSAYAGNYRVIANRYAARAAMLRGLPNRRSGDHAAHWDRLAAEARLAEAEAAAAAIVHGRLAAIER